MENLSGGPGPLLLSFALAAGAVAFGALILRILFSGIKELISRLQDGAD